MTNLIRLSEEHTIAFKEEMQEAFQHGFMAYYKDNNQWQVLPDKDFYQSLEAEGAEAYEAVSEDGQRVGGAIITANGVIGELAFLYVKVGVQSKGIGQTIWKTIEAMHPEEDLKELQTMVPHAKTIQLLSANPLALSYDRLMPRVELIKKYLPELEHMYTATRVSDIKNKTVEQLRQLREIGVNEISLGVESGDDWTLKRINKGYTSQDILEQCHKLEKAGIQYWMTFLNGVAGRVHSHEHAVNSAKIFNQCKPMLVGTGGLTLFPGTPLLEEAERGEYTPLTERELMQELLTFLELLTCDCELNTHHTSSMNLTGPDFLKRKPQILETLRYGIEHFDMDKLTRIRNNKQTL